MTDLHHTLTLDVRYLQYDSDDISRWDLERYRIGHPLGLANDDIYIQCDDPECELGKIDALLSQMKLDPSDYWQDDYDDIVTAHFYESGVPVAHRKFDGDWCALSDSCACLFVYGEIVEYLWDGDNTILPFLETLDRAQPHRITVDLDIEWDEYWFGIRVGEWREVTP